MDRVGDYPYCYTVYTQVWANVYRLLRKVERPRLLTKQPALLGDSGLPTLDDERRGIDTPTTKAREQSRVVLDFGDGLAINLTDESLELVEH